MCTPGLAACWFHRPWVRLKLPRNQSRDQYFPRLHRVTRGTHTLGTSMLCLWGCGSRGCISLLVSSSQYLNGLLRFKNISPGAYITGYGHTASRPGRSATPLVEWPGRSHTVIQPCFRSSRPPRERCLWQARTFWLLCVLAGVSTQGVTAL